MDQTISNNRVLTFFLALAISVIGGCATAPNPKTEQNAASSSSAGDLTAAAKPAPAAAPKPAPEPPAKSAPSDPIVGFDGVAAAADVDSASNSASTEDPPAGALPENNIWARIRAGLRMPKMDEALTRPHEQWFIENVEFREAMFERSKLYLYYIVEEVEKRGMPMEIALLPAVESAFKPYAYSRAKASGLWQFIPSTGKLYGLKTNWWYDGRRDVIASTRAALDYLQKLHDDFDGDWQLALAGYNAGEGRVARAREANRRKGHGTDFIHLKQLKPETRQYVPKLMAVANMVADPAKYGIQLPDVPNEPYFTTVDTTSQVDLGVIARLTGMEVDDLHFINPHFTRFATDPNGPHHVLVPVDKKEALLAGLSTLPEKERVQWLHHEVRRGDTVYGIARRYNLTVEAIKTSNKINGALRVGQDLLLPISAMAKINPPPGTPKPVRAAAKTNQPIIHKVRAGETLTSIARHYNVLVHQLAEWNVMQPNDVLQLGRKLKIWANQSPQADSRSSDTPAYA